MLDILAPHGTLPVYLGNKNLIIVFIDDSHEGCPTLQMLHFLTFFKTPLTPPPFQWVECFC